MPLMKMASTAFSSSSVSRNSQQRRRSIIFSICFGIDGDDVTGNPTTERRQILERIIKPTAGIHVGTYIEGEGRALFGLTKQKGMEGIIAKRKNNVYRPGVRTSDWLKIKARLQQEFLVEDSRKAKAAVSDWARCYWALIVMANFTTSGIRAAASAKKESMMHSAG